ncbi:MAG: CHASE2 domain-containing protein, partial [Cyanobacteria bacterium P01_A01_bin.135]
MVAASPWIAQLRHLRQFKPARLWGIGVAAGLVALGVQAVGGWRTLDYAGYKMLFHLRQAIAPLEWDPRIAVIAIDDRTLERYGQFPISRQYYTELLNRLLVSPPAAIGFDLLFVDPSPHDETLAAAMDRHWTVALPLAASPQGRLLQPVPPLKAAAAAHGHVMITADSDGVTRAVARYQGDVSTFGAALVQLYYESQRAVVGGDLATGAAAEASDKRPATPPSPSPLWVNWPGPVSTPQGCRPPEPEQLPIYPLDCILLGRTAPDTFNGRIVLVGVTATGIDPLRTPFNSAVPASNVYLHAAVIDNLLNGRPLRRPPGWLLVPLVAGMTLLALALQRSRLRPAAFALPGIWLAVGLGALVGQVWLPLAAPIAASLLAILGAQLNAQWENQQLKSLLAIHLDPTAASLLWQQRDRILNQGELPA